MEDKMKIGQLNRINELIVEIKKLESILPEGGHQVDITLIENGRHTAHYTNTQIWEILKPAFIAYCDKLKAELKELGFEE
jgi:hypothetical protein